MSPSIRFEGIIPHNIEQSPTMENLSEVLSGLNCALIDVESDAQGKEEVKDAVINKFYGIRDEKPPCRFLTFSVGPKPYVVVFQYEKDEEPNKVLRDAHTYENVWIKIRESLPEATLLDGGGCWVGEKKIILFGEAHKLSVGGDRMSSLDIRSQICAKLGWVFKKGNLTYKATGAGVVRRSHSGSHD